ncbi:Arm DNA-binding domain-containing protein [Ruegeria arenilitoris]|uniref:Arm DNA-binding domain-containing protein n=1 Tax=Ruegeria arenilitoris TaxID=1173585 RepID=UPI003C7A034A
MKHFDLEKSVTVSLTKKGFFLEVSPSGSKTWKLAYRFQGGQRSTVLGTYP